MKIKIARNTGIFLIGLFILILGMFIIYAIAPNPGHEADQIEIATQGHAVSELVEFTPGDILIYEINKEVTLANPTSWEPIIEMRMGQEGAVKVSFYMDIHGNDQVEYQLSGLGGNATEVQTVTESGWQGPFEHAIKVNKGDVNRLRLMVQGSGGQTIPFTFPATYLPTSGDVSIKEFKVSVGTPLPLITKVG